MKMEDLINHFKGDYERYPVYEFQFIPNYWSMRNTVCYDYETGEFVPNEGQHSIIFINERGNQFVWFESPYHENVLWSWAKHHNWGAHVEGHPDGNAWHYMLRGGETKWGKGNWKRDTHPNDYIVDYARDKYMKGSNGGSSASKHICDQHIMEGCVRNYFTKEVLTFPEVFDCMYCGELDWKTDRRWEKYNGSTPKIKETGQ